jgi:alanine racemase
VDRRLSNKGFYKIDGKSCPIIGRVSMNISSIDVSAVKDVHLEQEAVVISANPADQNSVENIAKLCGCISYEILVHIPQHLRRVVV